MNGIAQVPHAINNHYDRAMLMRAIPSFLHTRFAQVRDIPRNNTNVIKFRRYGSLTAATTALTEGVTPAGSTLSVTDVTATVLQYGDFIALTDYVMMTTLDPILMETAEVLGEQMGDTLDQLTRDVLAAGTSVSYGGDATARIEVAAGDLITADLIRKAVRTLKRQNAKRITRQINPSTGIATEGVKAGFIGIVHPDVAYTLETLGSDGWVGIEKYSNQATVMEDEIGKLGYVRFLETNNAKVFEDAGASGIDVHCVLILAQEAYAISRISGRSVENIIKALGSGGTEDPLNQRATSGWKATFVAKILNNAFMHRIEVAAAA